MRAGAARHFVVNESHAANVQRMRPFGNLGNPRMLTLPLDQIQPVIRIAHRPSSTLQIPERIIFDHELVLILAGRGEIVAGRKRMEYGPHDLLFIPPFTPHAFTASEPGGEHMAVHFDFAPDFPSFADDPERRTPYRVQLAHTHQLPESVSLGPGHKIEAAFGDLLRERASGGTLGSLAAAGHLTAILIAMLRITERKADAMPSRAVNQARVTDVIAYLQEHYAEPLSAADIAAVAGISQSRLNTLFQQMTGASPMEYLRRVRVEAARRLLGDVSVSVKEVAARTGFEDAYTFSKVFRRVDGLSPTDYRAAVLAGRGE